MPSLFHWLRRARMLARRSALEREMDEEMRFHIESEIAELVARGMEADVARRVAVVRFGGVERFKEDARDARGVRARASPRRWSSMPPWRGCSGRMSQRLVRGCGSIWATV
jgi:hypothetical protein